MASSLFYDKVVLIGTYVDTLFAFSYGDFGLLFSLRCRDSILSMCALSTDHNFIALGQAGGCIDVIKLQGTRMNQGIIVSSLTVPEAGYINHLVMS